MTITTTTRPLVGRPSRRSGITLTEILIAILIMGVGLVSLATLFPLALLRLRDAQRNVRSAMLIETAASDLAARNALDERTFQAMAWYEGLPSPYFYWDPWIQDCPLPDVTTTDANGYIIPSGVYRGWGLDGKPFSSPTHYVQPFFPGEGLPVAYDPLWWSRINEESGGTIFPTPTAVPDYTRFGVGLGFIRNDPNDTKNTVPSAHGLQRLTNFALTGSSAYTAAIFASMDDPVLQKEGEMVQSAAFPYGQGEGSPILPALDSSGGMLFDWTYSYIFTGRRSDVSNTTVYDGDIVILHNRPFGLDNVTDPSGSTHVIPAGERVVEAIFGYGTSLRMPTTGGTITSSRGFALGNERTVLLRWHASESDPEVRVGGWIADVTYERSYESDLDRFYSPTPANRTLYFPGQRCHWYRVVRVTPAEGEVPGTTSGPASSSYRRMIVTIDRPVVSMTELQFTGAATDGPYHINAALVCPYVVNVVPKVIYANHR